MKPNILFIMSDQHTPNVLGCYGNANAITPNLDKMASQGVLFENAYCNNPVCVPSRMSMLTGLHSHKIDVWHNADALPPQIPTWPLVMRLAGYETVISGRNHLLWGDKMGGFEKRLYGDTSSKIPYIQPEKTQIGGKGPQALDQKLGIDNQSGYYKHDEEANSHAVDYLRSERDKPFALFVGYYQPHAPFVVPEKYYSMYDKFDPPLFMDEAIDSVYEPLVKTLQLDREIDPGKLKTAITSYYAMVSHVDHLVGELVSTLEEADLLENTIVIYTSDHGEMLGRHRLWHKMCFYEDSVRVPMIMMNPSLLAKGKRHKENISLLDLFPTFLDWADYKDEIDLDGESLVPLLDGREASSRKPVVAESIGVRRGKPGRMVKFENYKLIHYHDTDPVLFDLNIDPNESRNLATMPEYDDIKNRLLEVANQDWYPEQVNRKIDQNLKHIRFHNQASL